MIKLEAAHIEEVRGIRKLDIDFRKETFAISGPNGSGKSGVIDAIEFGLTGQIGRLTGRGTKGLSVAEQGPHVDKTKFPDAAFVELKVFLPALGKSATITRKVSSPKKPKIVPADPDVKVALDEVADHPEITLSRREILQFILAEATAAAKESTASAPLIVLGYDENHKPRAARFLAKHADLVTKAAQLMDLRVYEAASEGLAALAKKLPEGRLFTLAVEPQAAVGKDQDDLPVATCLPRTWDEIAPGHLVIAQEALDYGWWEAVVLGRNGDMFTLRFRDYPKLPKFVRHRNAIALMSPLAE